MCTLGIDDYTKLKVYRTISLLSGIGKVVEIVVAELLVEKAERRELLVDGHYVSRKMRLAIDAVAIMVDRAHAAQREGHKAGVLLMDIKAAFPSVEIGRLIHTMGMNGMDGGLIQWTASFSQSELSKW